MKSLFFILIISAFISCTENRQWKAAEIDKTISKVRVNPDTLVFEEMNQLEVPPNIFDNDSVYRTSSINYCRVVDKESSFYCLDNYQCWAFFNKSETLQIVLGNENGYTGDGIEIFYKKGNYYLKPYTWTHIDAPDKPESIVKVSEQRLIVNQKDYNEGDSLYGQIYFHGTVTENGETAEHFVKGYFRAKIKSSIK